MKKALVFVLVVTVFGLAVYSWRVDDRSRSPLALQLEGLRAENGLYFHPSLLAPGAASLAETAYADQVLAMAGRRPEAPADRSSLEREAVGSAVWNRWYVEQIDRATGTSTLSAPQGLLDAAQPDGYLLDDVAPAPDDWTRLATTAAGMDVVKAHSVEVSVDLRRRMDAWIVARSGELTNPYQACGVATVARALGVAVPEAVTRLAESWSPPVSLRGDEAVLDVEGYACLNGKRQNRMLELLRARMSGETDGFVAYHLARAWIALGGDAQALSPMADALSARRLANGFFAPLAKKAGTIGTAYAVTEIRELAGGPQQDLVLAEGVERFVAEEGTVTDAGMLAEAALVLRRAGRPDPLLTQRAVRGLAETTTVTRDSVSNWVRRRRLQVLLTPDAPAPQVVSWPVDSRESRFQAWTLLGAVVRARSPADLAGQLTAIPDVLQREQLSIQEIRVGVEALRAFGQQVPVDAVRRAVDAAKGCPGLPDLYRAEVSATTCDIDATSDAYWLAGAL